MGSDFFQHGFMKLFPVRSGHGFMKIKNVRIGGCCESIERVCLLMLVDAANP